MSESVTTKAPVNADAHPDKHGGELCVEGTQVPVARILVALAEESVLLDNEGDSRSKTVEDVAGDFDLDTMDVQECLHGLADWLKTQDWTSFKFAKPSGTETGRWVCGEELAAFRAWQENRQVRRRVPDSDVVRDAKARIREALDADFIGELLSDARRIVESDHGTDAMTTAVAREVVRLGKNAFDLWWIWNKESRQTPATSEGGENCPKCGSSNYGPDGDAMADACWDCGYVEQEFELSCKPCLPDALRKAREEGAQQAAAQAGGGFRCPKCKTVFLDTGFPRFPGERGDDGSSGWRVTCPECKHEWNCLNFLPSVEDRLAELEKDVRQLQGQEESREADEKRAAEKRCGTCASGQGDLCSKVRFVTVKPAGMPNAPHHGVSAELIVGDDPNGPSWPDCRFWKPRE